jgi:hypothetical protein
VFPSARASQAIAKCRKGSGKVRKTEEGTALKRWQAEDWKDQRTGKDCGAGGKNEYCRPTERVSKKTPKTSDEMSSDEKKRKIREKLRVGMGDRVSPTQRKEAVDKQAVVEQDETTGKWILWNKDRTRRLGTHESAQDAYKQEYAIKKSQEKEASIVELLTAARKETNTDPTPAQIKAENYAKGELKIRGFEIKLENPKGSIRRGTDKKGNKWEQKMTLDYGYFKKIDAVDGDKLDVFIGPDPENGKIWVVDQVIDNKYDESKVMFGFETEEEARKGYLSNYEKGWKGLGNIKEMSEENFRKWVKGGQTEMAKSAMLLAAFNRLEAASVKLAAAAHWSRFIETNSDGTPNPHYNPGPLQSYEGESTSKPAGKTPTTLPSASPPNLNNGRPVTPATNLNNRKSFGENTMDVLDAVDQGSKTVALGAMGTGLALNSAGFAAPAKQVMKRFAAPVVAWEMGGQALELLDPEARRLARQKSEQAAKRGYLASAIHGAGNPAASFYNFGQNIKSLMGARGDAAKAEASYNAAKARFDARQKARAGSPAPESNLPLMAESNRT